MQYVPPRTMGNMASMMRIRVTSGSAGRSRRRAMQSGRLTGQRCAMRTATRAPASFARTAISSSTPYSPAGAIVSTLCAPRRPKGAMILWVNRFSGTLPSASPALTAAPASTAGVHCHFLAGSSPGRYMPGTRKNPAFSASCGSGFWRPS